MTLLEMSAAYAESEAALRFRITALRAQARQQQDPEAARALRARVAALDPLLREMRCFGGADPPLLRQELSQT